MKIDPIRATKFATMLRKFGSAQPSIPTIDAPDVEAPDGIGALITAYMMWDATPALATAAIASIRRETVDFNELRVLLEGEVVAIIGPKYPHAFERAERLHRALNDVYKRQHRTSLDHLRSQARREQRAYVEGISCIVPFVAHRTLVSAFQHPLVPIDDTTVEAMHLQGIADPLATTDLVTAWMHKHVKADDAARVHRALLAFTEDAWKSAGRSGFRLRENLRDRHEKSGIVARPKIPPEAVAPVGDGVPAGTQPLNSAGMPNRPSAHPTRVPLQIVARPLVRPLAVPSTVAPPPPVAKIEIKPLVKPAASPAPKALVKLAAVTKSAKQTKSKPSSAARAKILAASKKSAKQVSKPAAREKPKSKAQTKVKSLSKPKPKPKSKPKSRRR